MSDALLLDAEEAGRLLGVGRSTIYKLLQGGQLRGVRIGRARRFSRREVEDLAERLERDGGASLGANR
jgi:excisionase family DNA binding protein